MREAKMLTPKPTPIAWNMYQKALPTKEYAIMFRKDILQPLGPQSDRCGTEE